ncbi:MAG: metal-binding protein [Pseudomonadota bacterium]
MIPCDLCALDCGGKPFELVTAEKTLNFCCEGCRGIYEMLHEINSPPSPAAQNANVTPERKPT